MRFVSTYLSTPTTSLCSDLYSLLHPFESRQSQSSLVCGMAANRRCVALYDYQARDGEELTVSKNEKLTVVDDQGTWWKVRNDSGKQGLVPSNYVQLSPQAPTGRSDVKDPGPAMYQQTDLVTPQGTGPSLNIRAIAKFNYEGKQEDELSLRKDDEVIVMEKEADGWWRGRCGTRIGWFPFNYVEEQPDAPTPSAADPDPPKESKEKSFVCGVIALYSFNSGNPEELHFEKGDLMDIVDQPPDDPDWWEARTSDGTIGLVPRNYVEVVHDAEPVFGKPPTDSNAGRAAAAGGPPAGGAARSPPSFSREVWFHGKMARREAENILNSQAQNGQFIVRESETKPGDYSISMKAPDRIKHFNVKCLADNRLGIGQRKFDSMDELIQHYRRAPIYTTANEGKMYLGTGLPKR